uniref:Uncharacterized protein n=1 Tax=Arundo donax TaxID=35708 RepID=A0A0A9HCE1_ARUDO
MRWVAIIDFSACPASVWVPRTRRRHPAWDQRFIAHPLCQRSPCLGWDSVHGRDDEEGHQEHHAERLLLLLPHRSS